MEDYPKEAYREGDYILNHYDRNSHADKIILARNLHRWAIKYSAQRFALPAAGGRLIMPETG